jgi:2-C-methyl-D-erythritol 2,4-cyclodiphosphate synthase
MPKLSPFIPNIQKSLANTQNTKIDNISIKPKTTEKMGFCGRGEGIAVFASVLLGSNSF